MGILCGLTTAKGKFTVFTLRVPQGALRTLVRVEKEMDVEFADVFRQTQRPLQGRPLFLLSQIV